jgi:carbon-monoxide dehydrogenase small subunit
MKHNIKLNVNGEDYELTVESNDTLLSVLRDKLNLTGTKEGCGVGECGACVVIVNGKPINSCLTLACEVDNAQIITIEALAKAEKLNEIQNAFIEFGAIQCGFCTPGFIMALKALLDRNPKPTEKEIEEAFRGHLCRCTGYESIKMAAKSISKV